MSHIVTIETEVRDATAVQAACERLKVPPAAHGLHERPRLEGSDEAGSCRISPEWLDRFGAAVRQRLRLRQRSRLSLWLKCPLAFRLKCIDGIQFRTPAAVFLGKQVHSGLE
jgi:hypothetical protein